ncbi:helix-turn-helix transcriptional regulator [Aliarcobacter cryaerophilus]
MRNSGNIEISEELNISINTVKKHIKNIYTKLNVSDRVSFLKLVMG